jgi:hypothetical protein
MKRLLIILAFVALATASPALANDTIAKVRADMAAAAKVEAAQEARVKALEASVAALQAAQAAPVTVPALPGPAALMPQHVGLFDGMKARPAAPFAGVEIATGVLDYSKLKMPCVDPTPAGFDSIAPARC